MIVVVVDEASLDHDSSCDSEDLVVEVVDCLINLDRFEDGNGHKIISL